VLYATCYGGPIAIAFAAAQPERVSKLMLDGTYARGQDLATPEVRASVMASARMLATVPGAGHALLAYFTRPDSLETRAERLKRSRQCITGPIAEALYALSFEWDVSPECSGITMPTLVTHRRRSRAVLVEHGQRLASLIPDAEFVVGEGSDHNPWEGDAQQPLQAMARFLGQPIDAAFTRRVHLRPTVILFTDMEGSTSTTARMGDVRAQDVVRAHNAIVHAGLESHAGKRVKSTGDGVMAEFPSVSQALLAAGAIQRQLATHNEANPDAAIRVRMGVNAGEPLEEDDDLHGIVVNTASRICAQAHGGEVLVSNVVRELASGKGFDFADVGVFEMKGLDEPVRLFRLKLA
jgi:class 3 adenylate cyclase